MERTILALCLMIALPKLVSTSPLLSFSVCDSGFAFNINLVLHICYNEHKEQSHKKSKRTTLALLWNMRFFSESVCYCAQKPVSVRKIEWVRKSCSFFLPKMWVGRIPIAKIGQTSAFLSWAGIPDCGYMCAGARRQMEPWQGVCFEWKDK